MLNTLILNGVEYVLIPKNALGGNSGGYAQNPAPQQVFQQAAQPNYQNIHAQAPMGHNQAPVQEVVTPMQGLDNYFSDNIETNPTPPAQPVQFAPSTEVKRRAPVNVNTSGGNMTMGFNDDQFFQPSHPLEVYDGPGLERDLV